MFQYNKKDGVLAIVALALAIVPLFLVFIYLPQLGDSVPMRISSSGEVLRWSSKYELLIAPVLSIVLVLATFVTAWRQAKRYADDPSMAGMTVHRHMRNAVVQSAVFVVATGLILYSAVYGVSIGL